MSRKARMFITDKFDIYKFDNNSFAVCGGCGFRGFTGYVGFAVGRVCGFRRLRFAGFASAVCGGCGLLRRFAVCGVCGLRRLRFAAFAVCGNCGFAVDCGLRFCGLRRLRFAAVAVSGVYFGHLRYVSVKS